VALLSRFFDFLIESVFSEVFALYFLLGLVLFVAGLLLLGLFALSRVLGVRTTGTVIGAVERKRVKRKQRNGQKMQKTKTTLYPVFEYMNAAGALTQMRASEGGSSTLGYSTGQNVNLVVREDDGYDDVYDADKRGALYFGIGLCVIGATVMSWVGSIAAAFGIGLSSIVLLLLCYLLRGVVEKFTSKDPDAARSAATPHEPYSKAFDPADLHPIEYYRP